MLYTRGFLLTGVLAAAITLAALAELPREGRAPRESEPEPSLTAGDVDALGRLGAALETHAFTRDRLDEPDFEIAGEAHAAAALADGGTRKTLLRLADAASHSALKFLVDYNLAAGGWEAAAGIRMPIAAPAAF